MFKITFEREVFSFLIFLSSILILIGTGIGSSDQFENLKWLQSFFVPRVVAIDKGVSAELNYFPSDAYDEATLSEGELGFPDILAIILKNDPLAPHNAIQIAQRKDFVQTFYWKEKTKVGTIFLHLTKNAATQDVVYPVNLAPVVFGWIAQERAEILSKSAFSWNFWGALLALVACFWRIGVKRS